LNSQIGSEILKLAILPESSLVLIKKTRHTTTVQRRRNNITYKKKYKPQETVDPRTAG
jgi:hypothetical protein